MQQMYDAMRNIYVIAGLVLLFISCSPNNVTQNNHLAEFFKKYQFSGSFALLNNANDDFSIYNLEDYRDSAYAPGPAFDLLNAMIAIEAGTITDENSFLENTGSNNTLKNSFEKNPVFFDSLAKHTGKDHMQFWIDSLHYGQVKIDQNISAFWKDNSLKLSADEQLGFIKNLYFSNLPFQKRTQAIGKNLLGKEANTKYTLAYNKGIAPHGDKFVSLITGWIVENKHVYFFSLTTKHADKDMLRGNSEKLLKEILKDYGFFEGKK